MQRTKNVPLCTNWPKLLSSPHKVYLLFCRRRMMRDKKGIHNSYNSPDSINTIDWRNKTIHHDVFDYVRELIALRKNHPAFRMGDADKVRQYMEFLPVEGSNWWPLS